MGQPWSIVIPAATFKVEGDGYAATVNLSTKAFNRAPEWDPDRADGVTLDAIVANGAAHVTLRAESSAGPLLMGTMPVPVSELGLDLTGRSWLFHLTQSGSPAAVPVSLVFTWEPPCPRV